MESRRRGQRRLQPLDGGLDDRPRAGRGDLAEGPRRRPAVPLRLGPAVRARRPAPRPRRAQGARVLGFEATTTLDTMLDEVIPWIRDGARGGTAVTDAGAVGRRCRCSRKARRSSRSCARSTPAITTPHEILVVYDFDEDPTVPVIDRLARRAAGHPRPAQRPRARRAQRDEGRDRRVRRATYVLISMADGSDEPHVVDPMVELARGGADVVSASRYMKGGHQVGGPPLKRLMSRTAGLTLHWFGGVADPRPDQQLQALLAPLPRRDHDREHGGLRAGPRADGQGDARPPPRRRGPDDVARPDRRREQLQAPQVAAALPALVLDRDAPRLWRRPRLRGDRPAAVQRSSGPCPARASRASACS